ncbi:uncharacterized protein LOC107365657 isoform X2 [Tetranychus urticae]|uniref:Uncharacterized protein n=1 Tax=Tetranychus urticae TaxID=32264 RepID=T1KN37_TETUR|nr:uncharacterized protein LOC107365657 isoform X2 [Tetranychus urticae]
MAEHNNDSDKITFKVKHLDQYHDIVIDLNDDRNEYKHQQLFEQLESMTGVASRYTSVVIIKRPNEINRSLRNSWHFLNQKAFTPDLLMRYPIGGDDIRSPHFRDGERFHLQYWFAYEEGISNRINMRYKLVDERDIPGGDCCRHFCQYQCTEGYFNRLKDLVSNEKLNAKITQSVQPLLETLSHLRYLEADKIFREFNVKQYLYPVCVWLHRWRSSVNGHASQDDLYLRTRG